MQARLVSCRSGSTTRNRAPAEPDHGYQHNADPARGPEDVIRRQQISLPHGGTLTYDAGQDGPSGHGTRPNGPWANGARPDGWAARTASARAIISRGTVTKKVTLSGVATLPARAKARLNGEVAVAALAMRRPEGKTSCMVGPLGSQRGT